MLIAKIRGENKRLCQRHLTIYENSLPLFWVEVEGWEEGAPLDCDRCKEEAYQDRPEEACCVTGKDAHPSHTGRCTVTFPGWGECGCTG